jgi:hypothetical protein
MKKSASEFWVYAIAIAVLAATLPFYYLAWSTPSFGIVHDDAIHLVTAKALATGKGYRIISLPKELPQTKYPVLFPLLLSVVWRLDPDFPANLAFLKIVPLLCTVAWAISLFCLARRLSIPRPHALCIASLLLAVPWVLSMSGLLRSEPLFAALSTWALIYILDAEREGRLRSAVYAAVLAALAYHTRTAAMALMAGSLCGLLLAKRFRLALTFAALCFALCTPWILWQRTQQQPIFPHAEAFYSAATYHYENVITYFPLSQKIVIVSKNLLNIIEAPAFLLGCGSAVLGLPLAFSIWLVALRGLTRIRRSVAVVFITSILIPLLYAGQPFRYFVPILGLLFLLVYFGLPGNRFRIAAYALLTLQVFAGLWLLRRDSQRPQIMAPEAAGFHSTWPDVMAMEDWLRANSSPEDVVISAMDPLTYLYTGRKGIRGSVLRPLDIFGLPVDFDAHKEYVRVLNLAHVKYVVQMDPDYYDRFLTPSTLGFFHAGNLQEVHRVGFFRIYRLVRPPS